nr:toprim domain-containing protein [uncultured Cohaesibacter sp.]
MSGDLIAFGDPADWSSRSIDIETAKKWGFTRSEYKGEVVRVFNYKNLSGRVVAQKVRFKGKDFRFVGNTKECGLFGMHLWRDGGKRVVVTEGEIDAMSVSKAQNHKWPVVSIPTGAQGAKKALQKNLDWLQKFEEVVLMFDMDEPGQAAIEECVTLFAPGTCKVAKLPLKDANEMIKDDQYKELIDCIWEAKTYRPDGIVGVDDILDDVLKPVEWGLPWCFDPLTQATYGRRWGEIAGLGAGTGVGKTDFLTQQIAFDIEELQQKVGVVFLEQKPVETSKRIAGKIAGKMFHLPEGEWDPEELKRAVADLRGKLFMYDNFGQTDWDIVKVQIRYMAVSLGCRIIYLDHLTALADTGDEKGSLEQIMKEMAMLAEELNIHITYVSHLTTPDGKPHEEGGRVTIRHFKGSRAIGFWSYFMFGMERDQQAEDEEERQTTTFRVLKDRYTGQSTGLTFKLKYDRQSGRLSVKDDDDFHNKGDDEDIDTEDGGDF